MIGADTRSPRPLLRLVARGLLFVAATVTFAVVFLVVSQQGGTFAVVAAAVVLSHPYALIVTGTRPDVSRGSLAFLAVLSLALFAYSAVYILVADAFGFIGILVFGGLSIVAFALLSRRFTRRAP